MEHVSAKIADAFDVRQGGGEQDANSGDDDLCSGVGLHTGANVSVLNMVERACSIPVDTSNLGEGDELIVEIPLASKALPVGLNLGLFDVRLAPVRVELRRQAVPVGRNVRCAALVDDMLELSQAFES